PAPRSRSGQPFGRRLIGHVAYLRSSGSTSVYCPFTAPPNTILARFAVDTLKTDRSGAQSVIKSLPSVHRCDRNDFVGSVRNAACFGEQRSPACLQPRYRHAEG